MNEVNRGDRDANLKDVSMEWRQYNTYQRVNANKK